MSSVSDSMNNVNLPTQPNLWIGLISIEGCLSAATIAVLVIICASVFQKVFNKNPLLFAICSSIIFTLLLLFISNKHDLMYTVFDILLNAALNFALALTLVEMARKIKFDTPKNKPVKKMSAQNDSDSFSKRRNFSTSWLE